jgi:hypothetical protein
MAIGAVLGLGVLHARALRPAWRSAPAVIHQVRGAARALVAGVLTLGALELISAGNAAMFGAPLLEPGMRIGLAGLAAGVGLGWQRFRLDDRLRRWIG